LYAEEGKSVEAQAVLERSLSSLQTSLGPNHTDVAEAYSTLAAVYVSRAQYDQAESTCQHALAILENTPSPDYPALIAALRTYADLLMKTNQKPRAELFETKAMTYTAMFRELNNSR
jgi:tetratricopeptide (TPR) repeat protein